MEHDEMKAKWAEYDRKVDVIVRWNRVAEIRDGVRPPLRRFAVLSGLGAASGLITLLILGEFTCAHRYEPRFALPAVAIDIWTIAALAASVRQMLVAARIEYDKPLAAIRRRLESLRALRMRTIQWALLTGQVEWSLPF